VSNCKVLMKKNDLITAVVAKIGSNGEGVVKIDDTACFVPFALIGEKVVFKVLKVNKNVAYCKLIEVLAPSEDRVRPLCQFFTKCGGCQLQHTKLKNQLNIKRNIISDCFKKIANLNVLVSPVVKSDTEYYYRNKIQLPIRSTSNGNKIGFFYENSHRIIEIDECVIQKPFATEIIKAFNEFISKTNVSCYNDEFNSGLLKHVVAKSVKDAYLVIVVINGKELPFVELLIKILSKYFKKFSLIINENTLNNNVILGDKFNLVFGPNCYYNEISGIKYPVYPESFSQVNDYIKTKLYQNVVKQLNITSESVVIDAYSGAGLMTAMIALNAKKAIGIEIVNEAVLSANELAKINNLSDKMVNICAPCELVLPEIIEKEKQNGSIISVVLDPPRKGVDQKVLNAILKAMPNKIVYVACSPQSLARDVGVLVGSLKWVNGQLIRVEGYTPNYVIESVIPYDMFPQTKHIETLVVLNRN
ncbi:MAG: 23S rRNA (uracil(1939)-C(5))-methyltransferase RlmD, partial [Clostridia bacterium]|nr:23S rRNA (uracil(1939)-C(5))-methyltransferase RlmD [Clostridia bacterium]